MHLNLQFQDGKWHAVSSDVAPKFPSLFPEFVGHLGFNLSGTS